MITGTCSMSCRARGRARAVVVDVPPNYNKDMRDFHFRRL